MGTVVTMQVHGHGASASRRRERQQAVARAFDWFALVERTCSRFLPGSELRLLSERIGVSVEVSPLLFHAVRFALSVAEASNGAFDPTVGVRMERLGFDTEHRHGVRVTTPFEHGHATWRDVLLDHSTQSITCTAPLVLDLGAVAKGMAIDLAVEELRPFSDFVIDAGGDLYLGGHNEHGDPWRVGVKHPRDATLLFDTVAVSDCAVCTSGDYERRASVPAVHHLLDARTGNPALALCSTTVLAPTAIAADALATAAFVLGPSEGAAFLSAQGVDALLVTPELAHITTGNYANRRCALG